MNSPCGAQVSLRLSGHPCLRISVLLTSRMLGEAFWGLEVALYAVFAPSFRATSDDRVRFRRALITPATCSKASGGKTALIS